MNSDANFVIVDELFRLALNALNEKPNKSAVVSPFSIAMALGTVNMGANAKTSAEITDSAFGRIEKDAVASWFRGQLTELKAQRLNNMGLNGEKIGPPLSIASALFVENSCNLFERYATEVEKNFDSKVERVDFRNNAREQMARINEFVKEATKGFIPELIADGPQSNDIQCIVVNAIYLRARFSPGFNKSQTRNEPFNNEDGTTKQVEMMNDVRYGGFFESDGYAYAHIRFSDDRFKLFFIVPKKRTLAKLKKNLNSYFSFSATNLKASSGFKIDMAVPKFKTEGDFDLKTILKRLGISEMFDKKNANLYGIAIMDKPPPLHVDAIMHKAIFELDEEGVTAAAATFPIFRGGGPAPPPPPKRTIRADKPFLYGVTFKGAPLFVGQIY